MQDLLTLQFEQQKSEFLAHPYPSLEERKKNLKILYKIIVQHQDAIIFAIDQDFTNRSHDETRLMEILPSLSAIKYCLKHLKNWLKPQKREVSLLFKPARAFVMYQPLGVVGVMVPWNYPLFLAIGPLCQALAAGNRVMVKMSEYTPSFSALFQKMIQEGFFANQVTVIIGESEVAKTFSQLPFDHLIFTGSTATGKHILKATANTLTPTTLELGGKSPALIDFDANLETTAQRIAYGKSINSGQTCVAPDYVLIPKQLEQKFIDQYFSVLRLFYPSINHKDYTSIINSTHLERLYEYLEDAEDKGAKIYYMSEELPENLRLKHCVVCNTSDNMKLMNEEIFGPILPIVTYENISDAINYINQRPHPLALYYFGYQNYENVLQHTHSGGICINETVLHVGQEDLPFGGVGASGLGCYHAIEGFKMFSHSKSVFVQSKFSFIKFVYPPYGKWLHKKIEQFLLK